MTEPYWKPVDADHVHYPDGTQIIRTYEHVEPHGRLVYVVTTQKEGETNALRLIPSPPKASIPAHRIAFLVKTAMTSPHVFDASSILAELIIELERAGVHISQDLSGAVANGDLDAALPELERLEGL
jgi:hypothetical protein